MKNKRKLLLSATIMAITSLSACSRPEPIQETEWFHPPEAAHLLKKLPERKRGFRERLYAGMRGDSVEQNVPVITTTQPGIPD